MVEDHSLTTYHRSASRFASLSRLLRTAPGEPIAACINAGHWAARVIIQRSGCTYPEECAYSTEA